MKFPENPNLRLAVVTGVLCLTFVTVLSVWKTPKQVAAQNAQAPPAVAGEPSTSANAASPANTPPTASQPATAAGAANSVSVASGAAAAAAPAPGQPGIAPGVNSPPPVGQPTISPAPAVPPGANVPSTGQPAAAIPPNVPGGFPPGAFPPGNPSDSEPDASGEIQVSFQGANIEMIVQWLAKISGKSVVKHPRVQCQLTIVSSKKLPQRDAINLVYRAMAMEGFTTIESSKSILIVPEGQEPKMSPELMTSAQSEMPEGRQRLIKIFQLEHIRPSEFKDRIKGVLSEKASVETDDAANKLMVTDYTDNLRLLTELLPELDVSSVPDTVIEIFPLKYSEAEDLSALLNLVLNERPAPPAASRSSGPPSPGGPMPGGPPSMGGGPPGGGGGSAAAPQGPQQIRLWPDKTANRLIVTTPKTRLAEVQKLIGILDVEKPADLAVRVIPLKHVNASDLVKEIAPLYQKIGGRSLKETIEVTANNRSNSLIIMSSELNFKAIEKLVASLDTEDAQEKALQTFPLQNADAEDVATQLQDLYSEQDQNSRYGYYFYSPFDQKKGQKMNVVADRRRNTVIVQAPPASLPGIGQMIKALDEPVPNNTLAPKIFPLKFVSAVDIEDVLNELFLKKTEQRRSYWDYYSELETTSRDVGRLYGKVRITSEPYSNSIIVTSNSPESLEAVEDVLKQLDVPTQAGETTLRVGLKFAQAVTVASSINILFARGGSPLLRPAPQQGNPGDPRGQQQSGGSSQTGFELEKEAKEEAYFPWLGGNQESSRPGDSRNSVRPVSDLVGRVRVVPDRRTNSLLITSNVHYFPQVIKLVNELDAPTAQVLIEAKIIEVSTDFRDRLGVRWSPDGGQTYDLEDLDNSVMPNAKVGQREVFAGSPVANSLRTGILDASVELDVLIQFLRKTTDAAVLAEPQINVSDNELGKLFVGAQVPFIYNSLNTQEGGRNDAFTYKDVGIILEVTPHINNAEDVALKIRAESSNIRNGQTVLGGAIIDTRNFRTDVLVKSGQTLILGGIIQREESDTIRKVPLLGDIPWLGWAFKKKDKVSREVELMVFLRPRITRTPEQVQALVEEVEKNSPRLKHWREKSSKPETPK